MSADRGQFSSRLGFILAAAGSAFLSRRPKMAALRLCLFILFLLR